MGIFSFLVQEVPEGRKESAGAPWQFIGLMPLFDPPRHDSAETIRRALNLGVNVKMITGAFQFHNFKKCLACDPVISAYDMKCFLHLAELF